MSFDIGADAYGAFMGRYSEQLAVRFADALELAPGQRALDVGCGPGALTTVLVDRLGAASVCAADPSTPFVAAARSRLPAVDVRHAPAELLPWPDDAFDVAAAQLVVLFMANPVVGIAEMARVTRPGGTVAACVWDHAGGQGPLSVFWQAACDLDPSLVDERDLPGVREGHLAELFASAGLNDIESSALTVTSTFSELDEWWHLYTLGVGPAGVHVASLDEASRERLRARCAELLPAGEFTVSATAWTVVARAV